MVDLSEIERLRTAASRLRAVAAEVEGLLDPVTAFDRPDVWRGGRAQRFSAGLAISRVRLRAARWELEAEAARAEARVRHLEQRRDLERLVLPALAGP